MILFLLCVSAAIHTFQAQPVILTQPRDQTGSLFADVTFRVGASGEMPLSYQWRFNNAPLAGKTQPTATITNIHASDAGSYDVIVANSSGTVTSKVATLKVTAFNSLYFFGFSWTDTRGVYVPNGGPCLWPQRPTEYYRGRASNGPMWPEFISTNLGVALVPGNNFAFCGAYPADMLGQIRQMATPPKPELSLYFHWAGFDDTPAAATNEANWSEIIENSLINESNVVNSLYVKGARQIVVKNHFDLSKLPGKFSEIQYFGTDPAGLAKYSQFIRLRNERFAEVLDSYRASHRDLRLIFIDFYSKFNDLIARAAEFGFTETVIDALTDTNLVDKSFSGPGANYMFWDQYHPTSKAHAVIGDWTLEAINNAVLEDLRLVPTPESSLALQMNHLRIGRSYTLETSRNLEQWDQQASFIPRAGTNTWDLTNLVETAFFRLRWER